MKNLIVYSSDICPDCKLMKEWLEEIGINYIEKNISNDPQAIIELKGMREQC
jgi:glutaredoxin